MLNPIPDRFTITQADAALEALGLSHRGLGLISVTIGVHEVTVERYVKEEQPDGSLRMIGKMTVTVPLDRSVRAEVSS